MYPVSDAFLQSVQQNTRKYYWTGRITTKTGTVHEFGYDDILKGSGYISRQCCGSNEMELGTVYATEMGITLFSRIDRYTLEDAEIELFYHLRLNDGSYETVPMGVFEISEANRTVKCLEIKAYDYMLRFSGGQADAGKLSAITSMQIKTGGKHTLKGVGKNPRLARAKSKNDKNISGLINQIEENKAAGRIGIHTFTNAGSFHVGETDVKIISVEFATSEDVMAQFFGSVIVDVNAEPKEVRTAARGEILIPSVEVDAVPEAESVDETEGGNDVLEDAEAIGQTREQTVSVELPVVWNEDGEAVVHFAFEFNDAVIEIHQPEETWHSGKHTIFLYYSVEHVIPNFRNIFNVYMRCTGGTAEISTGDCLAAIMGQSMGVGEAWDGEIKVEEYIRKPGIGTALRMLGIADRVSYEVDETVKRSYSDTFTNRFGIGAFAMPVEIEED